MHIINLIAISGIFKKSDDLDILPPPPPFPEIDEELIKKGPEKLTKREEKRIQRDLERKKREEEKIKPRELELKKREEDKKRREEEKRKREIEKQRQIELKWGLKEEKRKKTAQQKQFWVEEKRKQRELKFKEREDEKRRKEFEKKKYEERERLLKQEGPKEKIILPKFFGEKEEKPIIKELKDLEKIFPKPKEEKKKIIETKLEVPEAKLLPIEKIEQKIEKPHEIVKAEEEIQRAIKDIKKPSAIKRLFKKKGIAKEVERPELMPKVWEKIDEVEIIEEKLHKARLALMDFKFDEAKRIYIEIPKNKVKVYQDIKDLYYERQTAEKFTR